MALPFQPKPRSIVFCDYRGFEAPEMIKRRPVIVFASNKRNPKLVAVVPLSTTAPFRVERYHYQLRQNPIPGQTQIVWAKCDMVSVIPVARLDLIRTNSRKADGKRIYLNSKIEADQFDEIRRKVASALGLVSLFVLPAPGAPPEFKA
jgi:uncharacterized protein YifN (PemK superfamily)